MGQKGEIRMLSKCEAIECDAMGKNSLTQALVSYFWCDRGSMYEHCYMYECRCFIYFEHFIIFIAFKGMKSI